MDQLLQGTHMQLALLRSRTILVPIGCVGPFIFNRNTSSAREGGAEGEMVDQWAIAVFCCS